ncbi:MAG TPA: N-acetylmuramic acid 6-phosphate etherase [Mycobacteriales bacterium]|nr:N-acetylmuramic acid 6-phosphate etherase [Mycobacteriales bacterium]
MNDGVTTGNGLAHLGALVTEQIDPRRRQLEALSTIELAAAMNDADAEVPRAVQAALPAVVAAIDAAVPRLERGGRLIYVGAGTSGRLAVLDAAECPPTFRTDPEQVQAVIAGGDSAIRNAAEGAEDDFEAGAAALRERRVGPDDVVVGLSASGRTPYVLGAVAAATAAGALTAGIMCNRDVALAHAVQHPIEVVVGPEVLTGSTRLKAGTAQKLVLNMMSTIIMVRLGKTYGSLMVDLKATNEKLVGRAQRIVSTITGVEETVAAQALQGAGGEVKTAVVMIAKSLPADAARALVERAGGHLDAVL